MADALAQAVDRAFLGFAQVSFEFGNGLLDRVELTNSAVKQFFEIDVNKDRFLTEDEFKKAQENETKKMRAVIQAMQPAQPAQPPRPAPAQPRAAQPQQAPQQPQGLAPGLPQGTR